MNRFFNNGRSGSQTGVKRYGKQSDDHYRNGSPIMHKAICSDCGRECEIPFKPTQGKPVFCSKCFEQKDGGGRENRGNRRGQRDRRDRRDGSGAFKNDSNIEKKIDILNRKLDKVLKALEVKDEEVVEVEEE